MIHIAQCLCPKRHCILALAYDAGTAVFDESPTVDLKHLIEVKIFYGLLNPWCGICHERDFTWTYEDAVTRFATMEEARPELAKAEAEQARTRAVLGNRN